MTIEKFIKERLYIYTNQEMPQKLLIAIISEMLSEIESQKSTNRIGIMGITKEIAEANGYKHIEMLDDDKCLSVGTKLFVKIFSKIRRSIPSVPLDEWYLFSLYLFHGGGGPIPETWEELESDRRSIDFAEKVWERFKKDGGVVT